MVIILLVWSIETWIMWLRSRSYLKRRGRTEVAGEYKAVFELADTIRTRIQEYEREHGDDVPAVTESGLRRRVMKDLRGGSISYTTPLLSNEKVGQGYAGWNFRAWMKRNHMSFFALFVSFAVALIIFVAYVKVALVLFVPLPLECAIYLYLGTSQRSRTVLFFWLYVVISVVPQIGHALDYAGMNQNQILNARPMNKLSTLSYQPRYTPLNSFIRCHGLESLLPQHAVVPHPR
jgi:hypothetical protein